MLQILKYTFKCFWLEGYKPSFLNDANVGTETWEFLPYQKEVEL